MFFTRTIALAAAALALGVTSPAAQNPTLATAMRQKLANAQGLLEPIVKADYPLIARYAESLSRISETEIASWQTLAQPEYVEHATTFLLSVQGLNEAAAARNMDEVTREYGTLISSCIKCHTYVRTPRRASLAGVERAPAPTDLRH
jgi:cytochrome c556